MGDGAQSDPILNRLRAEIGRLYGARLDRLVLFGSRARGDHRPDSDYDVAVFLRDMPERAREIARLVEIETDILFDTGSVVNALPLPADALRERTGFMSELRREGREI